MMEKADPSGAEETSTWLYYLRQELAVDEREVIAEYTAILDEEGRKRGPIDWESYWAWRTEDYSRRRREEKRNIFWKRPQFTRA